MEDKEFLELHKNVTAFSRGEQPVFSEHTSVELPRLEDVENYVPDVKENVAQKTQNIPELNMEQLADNAEKTVGQYFKSGNEDGVYDDNDLQDVPVGEETSILDAINQSDTMKAVRRSNAYKTYMYNNEDVIAEARKISQATNVAENIILSSPETLNNMRDVYKAYEKEKDIDKVYERYPGLKGLAEKDESAAALAISNLEDVKVAHGIIDNIVAGAKKYWLRYQRNMIGADAFYGKGLSAENIDKLKTIDKQIKEAKEVPDFFDAPIDNALGTTIEQVAMMANQYARGGWMGLLGAGVGYVGTKTIGAAAGTVTGTGPIALMATEQLARQNAMRGMGIGMRVGGGKAMFDELAGQYYLQALEYKNKAGGQQFTEDEARLMAGLQAGIETMIELGTTESVLKILGKNPSTAPAKEILQNLLKNTKDKESAIALLKTEGMNIIRKTFKVGKEEAIEEGKQQFSTDLIGNVFAAYVAPDGHEKYGLNVLGPQELFTRATEATVQAAVPSFTMGLAGAGGSSVRAVRSFMGNMQLKEALNEVGLDYNNWAKNTNGVQMLRDLKEKFANTKFAKEHPEEAEALLKETLKDSGYENVTVDTELFKKEEGGSEILYQLASAAGMTEEQVQAAIENNENITVPTDVYAKSVKDNPIADKLLDKISFDKEGDCLERCRKYAASMKHAWDKMIDAESTRKMEAAYNVLKDTIGEEDAMNAMGIVELYPENPEAGAKKKAQEQQQEIDRLLKPVLEIMNQNIHQGVTEYYSNRETGEYQNPEDVADLFGKEETASSGSYERVRASNNAQWYQNFVKAHGRIPTQTEMRQIAEDVFSGKNEYGVPGWEVNDVETEEAAEANARMLANLKADKAMYERLSEKLKNFDAGKVAAAEGLTESGYAAYKYLVDNINGAEMNKATQRSVAAGAMLWAHVAERYAEAYQAMGQDVTALDVIKRFKFSNKDQGAGLNQKSVENYSYEENQYAIKEYFSKIDVVQDLVAETRNEVIGVQNASENEILAQTIKNVNSFINKEIIDPLGHRFSFQGLKLNGEKVAVEEYLKAYTKKDKKGGISTTKAFVYSKIEDTVSNPLAIIEDKNADRVYMSLYQTYNGNVNSKVVVGVKENGDAFFYTLRLNSDKKGRKNALNDFVNQIQSANKVLYIRGRQSEHPLHPTDQRVSMTDAGLHSSGNFILPQYYNNVNNQLTNAEKMLISNGEIYAEMQVVGKKYKGKEYKDYLLKAPDGTESSYSLLQWILIHTESFKNLYGDWEAKYQQKKLAEEQRNAIAINLDNYEYKGFKATKYTAQKLIAPVIGEVKTAEGTFTIAEDFAEKTFDHNRKGDDSDYNKLKLAALEALPEGLKRMVYFGEMEDNYHKLTDGKGNIYPSHDRYYGYWVNTSKGKALVYLRLRDQRTELERAEQSDDSTKKLKLYLHDVFTEKEVAEMREANYDKVKAEVDRRVASGDAGADFGWYVVSEFMNRPIKIKVEVLENGEPNLNKLDNTEKIFMQKSYNDSRLSQWFGDSKVVDTDGNPKVMYHGTGTDGITEFKHSKAQDKMGRSMAMGQGKGKFYFATSEGAANIAAQGAVYRGQGKNAQVMPVYLRIENPVNLDTYKQRYQEISGHDLNEGYSDSYTMKDRDKFVAKLDKQLKAEGVDGIYDEGYGFAAVFEPTQIKSAVKNNGNYDINNPNIFMQQAAEPERDLVAYHNISTENLKKAIASGGLPVPSIAITQKDIPFTNFGDITLVGTKDIIDPEKNTDVYSRDAYTTRVPRPVYKAATTKQVKAWEKKYLPEIEELGGRISEIQRIISEAYNYPMEVQNELERSPELMAYYLTKIKGVDVKLPRETPEYRNEFLKVKADLEKIKPIIDSNASDVEKREALAEPVLEVLNKQIEIKEHEIEEAKKRVDRFILQGRSPAFVDKAKFKVSSLERDIQDMRDAIDEYFETDANGKKLLVRGEYVSIVNDVKRVEEIMRKGTPVDWYLARSYMNDYHTSEMKDYGAFVNKMLEELMGEPKLKVGNKYLPYTLGNIVDAMVKKRGAGQEDFAMTNGKVAGIGAKKFTSVAEIRKEKRQLRTEEEMKAIIADIDANRDEVVNSIAEAHDFDQWGFNEEFNEALAEVIKGNAKPTAAKIKKALAKRGAEGLTADEINQIIKIANNYREAATWYFEAKPQRAVGLEEFAGAVVPDSTDPELIKQLENMGLTVETYGIGRTRQEATKAIQDTQDVLFQNTQGFIEFQQQGQYVVHLLENADESTFMHEMSHGFYDMMKEMALTENAPDQVKKDYETLRKWAEWNPDQINEYKGTAVYSEFAELDRLIREAAEKGSVNTVDVNGNEHVESYQSLLNRWQQERFARGFEEYLRQGKAPTEGMKGIFSKFKNWLVKIYKGCVGVGAKPTEAVKEVMDRMIASQEEIDLAMKRAEILKWKEAGAAELLTKTSKEYYDNLLAKAREEAEAKVLKLAMKDLNDEEKAKYNAKLNKEREAATERIKQKPVFMIQQYLEQNPGLNIESVAKLLGNMTEAEYKQQLKLEGGSVEKAVDRYMEAYKNELDDSAKPGGEQYQAKLRAAAEEAVITSKYTDLIAAYELQAYKKAVQRIRRLDKRLADIEATDEAERKQAEAAIRKEEKAKNEQEDRDTRVQDLRRELKSMKESIRAYGKNSQDEITQARYYANNKLDTLPVGEATDFRKWGNLAVRKHQEAMDMLNVGKLEEATKLQKDVLVYRMLEKRAYELNQKYEKKVTRMAARSRTIAREHSMDANDTYLYNHLLYIFGLTDKDAPRPADFPGVQEQLILSADGVADENTPQSSWIQPDDWLMNAITGEVPMENGLDSLTMEQFREVEELMQYVYFTGKDRNSVKTLTDTEGNSITIEELNASIAVEAGEKRGVRDTRKNVGGDSALESAMRAARKYKVELIKPETILNAMGESAMKYLYNPLRKCADKELTMNQELVNKQQAVFAQYRDDVIQSMGKKEGEKFLKDFSSKQQYVLGGMTRFRESKLTHEELVCLALNLGTEIGHKRVLDIYEMNEGKLRDLLYNLTGADWNLIQNIWDLHEQYWPELQKVTANVTGVTMEKQQAREFTVISKDGVSYPIKGGYYHLAYDPTKNLKINEQKADERLTTQSGSNRRFGIGIGMTKERNQYEVKYALKLDLGVMQRALAETVHYISFYETVKNVNRLINTYEFADTVVGYFGEEHYQVLQKWVKDAWALEPESKTAMEQMNASMRANQTMATLGFSMITAAENILNIAPMMAEIGPLNAVKAVANYYGQMFRTGLTNPMEMFDQNAFIAEHSVFMAERGESIDPNIHKAQSDNGMDADNIITKGFKKTQDAAFYFITQTDLMLGRPLWMHEYQRVYNECLMKNMSPEVAERQAVQAGDAAVRHVFGSAADVDKADIQKSSNELVKFATMFYSYFSTVHNAMVSKGYEYQEQRHKGAGVFKAAAPTLVWGAMMWYLLPSIGSAVMRAYFKGSDDDREPDAIAKKIASTLAGNIFGGLPFLRDLVPTALDMAMGERTYGFRNAPMYEAGKQAITTVSTILKAAQGDKDAFDVMRSLGRVMVYMSRFPLTATNAMVTAAQWINEGDLSDDEMAEYLRAMIMNQKPKK